MEKLKSIKNIFAIGIFVVICGLAAGLTPDSVEAPWYSIVPPALAVTLALITHRVVVSLASAVLVGGLLATIKTVPEDPSQWILGVFRGLNYFFTSATNPTNLQILAFVAFVMMMISLLIVSGGLHGIVQWLSKFSNGKKSTQLTTALMGVVVFVDDYANSMIVGSAMRPLTDQFKVSREKLAFIVDATAAPIAGIALFSTWIGYEVGLFTDASKSLGLGLDGYSMFFDAIAFRFYCFLMLIFVFINILSGKEFGSMLKAERRAGVEGLVAGKDAVPMTSKAFLKVQPHSQSSKKAITAVFPLLLFFFLLIGGLWVDGGGLEHGFSAVFSLTAWKNIISASENNILLLAFCAAAGWLSAFIISLFVSKVNFKSLSRSSAHGFMGSLLPMLILIMAWSLKGACDDLQTGKYLISTIGQVLSPLWFPAIIFVVAGLTAFATGTSWGTMGILFPIVIPIAYEFDGSMYGITTMICLGAILDGAIFGDHCSPISDTTILSSIATSCDHIDHVKTQIPYSLFVAGLALVLGYIPAALGISSWFSLTAGAVVIYGFFKFVAKHPESEIATS